MLTKQTFTWGSPVPQPLYLYNNAFWRLWIIMYLKILWKLEHLLKKSKYSIFHNIFKKYSKLNLIIIFLNFFNVV